MSSISVGLVPAWTNAPLVVGADGDSQVVVALREIADLVSRGDRAQAKGKQSDAVASWKSARSKILALLIPSIDAGLSVDVELPVGPEIEQQMAEAMLGVLEALREATPPTAPVITPSKTKTPPKLEALRAIGFHSLASTANHDRAAEAAHLLARGRAREASTALDLLIGEFSNDGSIDRRVRASAYLNRAAARVALSDNTGAEQDAVAAYRDYVGAKDPVGRAQALHTAGVAALRNGRSDAAEQRFREAVLLVERLPPSAKVTATEPALAETLPSPDLHQLGYISERLPTKLSVRWPGKGGGLASVPVPNVIATEAMSASWSVGFRHGAQVTTLAWKEGRRPSATILLEQVYEPRASASDRNALEVEITHLVELTVQLPYLYAFALPRRLGDAHAALNEYALAENAFRTAIRFGYLNHAVEGTSVWAALANNVVAWADALYRAEDLVGCREKYALVLGPDRGVPTTSYLYSDPTLAAAASIATTVIMSLDAPPADADPAIVAPILRAAMRWEYLDAGLDFFGTDFTPVFTFAYLQEVAKQMASRAIQAERDYIHFQNQAESEAANRRDLEAALAAAAAERDAQREHASAARNEREALEAAASLARLRVTNAQADRDKYAVAGYWQYRTQAIATAHGAGVDFHTREIRELAADMEAGSWEGEYGKLAAAAVLLGGEKSYEYQLARLDMAIAESRAAVPIADAQASASRSRERASQIAVNAAHQQLLFASSALAAFDNELFTPQTWAAMASFMRDIARSYLDWAIRISKLMERAYNFETDGDVRVIRNEYVPAGTAGTLGGDALLRDVESFTYFEIVGTRSKDSQLKDVISLANEYPFAFAEFMRTGRMSIETVLHDLDLRHPGFHRQRLAAVEVEIVGLLPQEGVRGMLRAGGVSRFRTASGDSATRVHSIDTLALSEHTIRNDAFLFRSDPRRNGVFEGMGPATTWLLELPRRSNNFDYRLISDVRLILYYTARFDAALHDQVLSRDPLPGELIHARSFVMRYDFPEVWYGLLDTGVADFEVTHKQLPRNEANFTIANLAVQVVTRPGTSPADVQLTLSAPGRPPVLATLDTSGIAQAGSGQPLEPLIGAALVGGWRLGLVTSAGGPPPGENEIEDVLLLVQYGFEWPE